MESHKTSPPALVDVLGIPVSATNMKLPEELIRLLKQGSACNITFVNPHACYLAQKSAEYRKALDAFDWVLCDGIGMVLAARHTGKLAIDRAAFDLTSIARPVLKALASSCEPVVLVGGKPGVAEYAAGTFRKLFPGLNVVKTFEGYDSGPASAIEYLAQNSKHVAICGMGAPRQEAFLLAANEAGWSGVGFTCGGFFDQINEKVDYYPSWVDKLNLRFMYRLFKEPKRLGRRYLVEYQVFVRRYLKALISK